jgi:hypothetical protein
MNTERVGTLGERELSAFREQVRGMRAEDVNLVKVEREIQERLNAIGREMVAEAMVRADTTSPEVEIEGKRWGNQRRQRASYQTVFGAVSVERSIYQQAGRGRVAVPMDVRLGIFEGAYTPRVARILTRAIAVMTEEEAAGLLAEVGTAALSQATLSRIPRIIAARYELQREVIEPALRARDVIPDGTVTLQVALDGVMVPQDGEEARPRGRKTDSPAPPRHEQRYGVVGAPGPRAA